MNQEDCKAAAKLTAKNCADFFCEKEITYQLVAFLPSF